MQNEHESCSICYEHAVGHRTFHECTTANHTTCFVRNEIQQAMISLGHAPAVELKIRVKALIENAKNGTLHELESREHDILSKPCASQPDIWELRIRIKRGGLFRLYYSEKGNRDPVFIALCFQQKKTDGKSTNEIRLEQDKAIDLAQERFDSYSDINWGHIARGCTYCV